MILELSLDWYHQDTVSELLLRLRCPQCKSLRRATHSATHTGEKPYPSSMPSHQVWGRSAPRSCDERQRQALLTSRSCCPIMGVQIIKKPAEPPERKTRHWHWYVVATWKYINIYSFIIYSLSLVFYLFILHNIYSFYRQQVSQFTCTCCWP